MNVNIADATLFRGSVKQPVRMLEYRRIRRLPVRLVETVQRRKDKAISLPRNLKDRAARGATRRESATTGVRTVEVAVGSLNQACVGICSISRVVHVVKDGDFAGRRHSEHDAIARLGVANGCSVEVSVGALDQRADRMSSVRAVKAVQDC